jgi:hypothetical protein
MGDAFIDCQAAINSTVSLQSSDRARHCLGAVVVMTGKQPWKAALGKLNL